MPAPDRDTYEAHQAQLLDALLHGLEPPAGFNAAQTRAAGRSLRRKRGRRVARAWPALALELGDSFDACFDSFARATDAPASGGAREDGLAFARALASEGRLGDEARSELLLARVSLRRRGVLVRAAWLRRPRPRLLVVARLPWLGARQRSVPRPR